MATNGRQHRSQRCNTSALPSHPRTSFAPHTSLLQPIHRHLQTCTPILWSWSVTKPNQNVCLREMVLSGSASHDAAPGRPFFAANPVNRPEVVVEVVFAPKCGRGGSGIRDLVVGAARSLLFLFHLAFVVCRTIPVSFAFFPIAICFSSTLR